MLLGKALYTHSLIPRKSSFCYGAYVALTGRLSRTPRNSHVQPVIATYTSQPPRDSHVPCTPFRGNCLACLIRDRFTWRCDRGNVLWHYNSSAESQKDLRLFNNVLLRARRALSPQTLYSDCALLTSGSRRSIIDGLLVASSLFHGMFNSWQLNQIRVRVMIIKNESTYKSWTCRTFLNWCHHNSPLDIVWWKNILSFQRVEYNDAVASLSLKVIIIMITLSLCVCVNAKMYFITSQ